MTVVVIMGKNQVIFYVAFTCFMWIVLLFNTEIIGESCLERKYTFLLYFYY